jgi:type I protein arginine methyltransferase
MTNSESYSGSYHDVETHKKMLQDVLRTEAYEGALRHFVKSGCSVMDFGCGTGILSIFASKFGAKKVYAIDRSIYIQTAFEIARNNKIKNIDFYHCDHKEIMEDLDATVDILVSEWMGHFLFYEAMLTPLLHVRDKFLAKGGIMIPGAVSLYGGLVTDKHFYDDCSFLLQKPYNINFAPIADTPLYQASLEVLTPKQMLDTVVNLGTIDLNTVTLEEVPKQYKGKVIPNKNATIYGLSGWFSADLAPNIILGTGPDDPPTHWMQIYFPFSKPFEVKENEELTVTITPPSDNIERVSHWRWSVSDGEQTIEMNDLDHRQQLNPFLSRGLVKDTQS